MRKYSKEEKAKWLKKWKVSGKSAWSYAKEIGINPQTFTNWTKPRGKAKKSFVEVSVKALQSTRLLQELTMEKDGITIHIPLSASVEELEKVFTALAG